MFQVLRLVNSTALLSFKNFRLELVYSIITLLQVIVTAHIPPGVHTPNGLVWMWEQFNEALIEVLQTYASIIVGMHFGHDHADGFKIFTDANGNVSRDINLQGVNKIRRHYLDCVKRIWYLWPMRAAKVQASLRSLARTFAARSYKQ